MLFAAKRSESVHIHVNVWQAIYVIMIGDIHECSMMLAAKEEDPVALDCRWIEL